MSDFEDKFDAILDINDPKFAEKFMDVIGVKPGDSIQFSSPQFDRTDGRRVPLPICDFSRMNELSDETLREIGCQVWDEDASGKHWLYPAEWYDHIPDGTEIVVISGKTEKFEHGKTDNDRRFGALAYGFIKLNVDTPAQLSVEGREEEK